MVSNPLENDASLASEGFLGEYPALLKRHNAILVVTKYCYWGWHPNSFPFVLVGFGCVSKVVMPRVSLVAWAKIS